MNRQAPDLGLWLAAQAIREHYRPRKQIRRLEAIERFCRGQRGQGIALTFLRLQRLRIDRMAVGIALASLPAHERQIIQLRYRDRLGCCLIAEKAHCSASMVGRIHKRALSSIRSLLSYSLSPEDIFQRDKAVALLGIIDMRIMAAMRQEMPVSAAWLAHLQEKRCRCRALLDLMQGNLAADGGKAVAAKLAYPLANVTEISWLCGISKATVSRQLRQYMVLAYAYI